MNQIQQHNAAVNVSIIESNSAYQDACGDAADWMIEATQRINNAKQLPYMAIVQASFNIDRLGRDGHTISIFFWVV